MERSQRNGMLFIFLAVSGYAFLPTIVKHIQLLGMPPLDIATWRFTFALPVLWLIVFLRRVPPPENPLPRLQLVGLGVLMVAAALTAFFALERMPASTLIVLFYTYPTIVAIISLFMGERLSMQGWVALALTLIGIALTVPNLGAGWDEGDLIGVGMALLNAVVIAIYYVLNSRILRGHNALMRASGWVIVGSFATMMLSVVIRRELMIPDSPALWLYLLVLATVCTVLPIFCLTIGIQKLGAPKAAIIGTVEPILTIIIATITLGERMQPGQVVGGVFIIASVILLQLPGRLFIFAGRNKAVSEGAQ